MPSPKRVGFELQEVLLLKPMCISFFVYFPVSVPNPEKHTLRKCWLYECMILKHTRIEGSLRKWSLGLRCFLLDARLLSIIRFLLEYTHIWEQSNLGITNLHHNIKYSSNLIFLCSEHLNLWASLNLCFVKHAAFEAHFIMQFGDNSCDWSVSVFICPAECIVVLWSTWGIWENWLKLVLPANLFVSFLFEYCWCVCVAFA